MAMPNKLIAVDIFSSRVCVLILFQLGFINYKGVRNPEFQKIGRIKAALLSGGTSSASEDTPEQAVQRFEHYSAPIISLQT